MQKVLLMKLRYIGDTLSIIPVAENIRKKAPHILVDVMVNRGTEELIAHHPAIRKLWIYDRHRAKQNSMASMRYLLGLFRDLRAERYDQVLDFTLGDRSAFLAFLTGARERIGYQVSTRFSRLLMNRFVRLDPARHHIVDYQLAALRFLGIPDGEPSLRVHVPVPVQQEMDRILEEKGLLDPNVLRVAIHPGARKPFRMWRPERFADVADRIRKEQDGVKIFLLGAPEEAEIVEEVERHMKEKADWQSTRLSLLQMAALLYRCGLFLGNDSAPGHIAGAVGCPTLSLFGPTFPLMWRPVSPRGRVVFKDFPCCGCRQDICIRPDDNCMDAIQVDEVWTQTQDLLRDI